jgi:hypothetical protein
MFPDYEAAIAAVKKLRQHTVYDFCKSCEVDARAAVDAALGDGDPEKQAIADAWNAISDMITGDTYSDMYINMPHLVNLLDALTEDKHG